MLPGWGADVSRCGGGRGLAWSGGVSSGPKERPAVMGISWGESKG